MAGLESDCICWQRHTTLTSAVIIIIENVVWLLLSCNYPTTVLTEVTIDRYCQYINTKYIREGATQERYEGRSLEVIQ